MTENLWTKISYHSNQDPNFPASSQHSRLCAASGPLRSVPSSWNILAPALSDPLGLSLNITSQRCLPCLENFSGRRAPLTKPALEAPFHFISFQPECSPQRITSSIDLLVDPFLVPQTVSSMKAGTISVLFITVSPAPRTGSGG